MLKTPKHLHNQLFILVRKKGKIPIEKDWINCGEKHDNPDVLKWVHEGGNLGVLTGNGIVVFDADNPIGEMIARNLSETLVVGTSTKDGFRGKHFYYKCERQRKIILFDEDEHIGEIQARGQFVVAPGSIHPSGQTYDIIEDRPIADITENRLLDVVGKFMKKDLKPIDVKELQKGVKEGNRNDSAFRLASFHRKTGADFNESLVLLNDWNLKLANPLPYSEIETIVKSAYTGRDAYNFRFEGEDDPTVFFEEYVDTQGKKRNRFVTKKLAESILKEKPIKTLRGSRAMYSYENGVYLPNGQDEIRRICVRKLGKAFKLSFLNECIGLIQGITFTNPADIGMWLNLENGLLNPVSGEFKEHTPDVFSIKRTPVIYDKSATCTEFREKLDDKLDKETRDTVQETFGYCLLPGQRFEKAFLMYGPPRSMKSTTLYALEQMLGKGNITSFSLQFLTQNNFALAYLYGTPANICADLSSTALKETGPFMLITGGDPVTSARKHEHPITYNPSTKLIFSCNVIPGTTNKNMAFYRRWILLNFAKQTESNNVDSELKNKINDEMSGILNWAIEGLQRLIENDGFSIKQTDAEIKDIYERNSDTIASYIFNEIDTSNDEGKITKREVFASYLAYCKFNKLTQDNVIKFGKWFKEHTGCGTARMNGIPCYTGISFKKGGIRQHKLKV